MRTFHNFEAPSESVRNRQQVVYTTRFSFAQTHYGAVVAPLWFIICALWLENYPPKSVPLRIGFDLVNLSASENQPWEANKTETQLALSILNAAFAFVHDSGDEKWLKSIICPE